MELTPFDLMIHTPFLQMSKLLIPYLPPKKQKYPRAVGTEAYNTRFHSALSECSSTLLTRGHAAATHHSFTAESQRRTDRKAHTAAHSPRRQFSAFA